MKQFAWIGFVVAMLLAARSSFPSSSGEHWFLRVDYVTRVQTADRIIHAKFVKK